MALSKLLFDTFNHNPAWANVQFMSTGVVGDQLHDMWFFPVDNTIGRRDPVVNELMRVIQTVTSKELHIQKMVSDQSYHSSICGVTDLC